MLCANLRDLWRRIVGVLSKNVFCTNLPAGGAVTAPCYTSGAEVHLRHLGNVHAQFRCDQAG